jgi:hypothetical protein
VFAERQVPGAFAVRPILAAVAVLALAASGCDSGGSSAAELRPDPASSSAVPSPADISTPSTPAPRPSGRGLPSASAVPAPPGTKAPAPPLPTGGPVRTVGPEDAGRTVSLKVGDRLDVTLPGARLGPRWVLQSYPQTVLRADIGASTFGLFRFVAVARGAGPVIFARFGCDPRYERPCIERPPPIDPDQRSADETFMIRVQVS